MFGGMQKIPTGGITGLTPLAGHSGWYWGSDFTSGDLYEAEELYRAGHRIRQNRLIFIQAPTGRVLEPVAAKEGQYFGVPVYDRGRIVILLADFPAGEIRLLGCDGESGALTPIVTIPRGKIADCYNLMPHTAPLMLTRQAGDRFEILWPERSDFPIAPSESFDHREGDRLYFSKWYEDPDYREEVVVRRVPDGKILAQCRGSIFDLPDGRRWLLTDE